MFCSSSPFFLCSKSSKYTHPVVILCSFLKKGTKLVCFENLFLSKKRMQPRKRYTQILNTGTIPNIFYTTLRCLICIFSGKTLYLNNNNRMFSSSPNFSFVNAHPVVIQCLLPQITYLFATFTNYILFGPLFWPQINICTQNLHTTLLSVGYIHGILNLVKISSSFDTYCCYSIFIATNNIFVGNIHKTKSRLQNQHF